MDMTIEEALETMERGYRLICSNGRVIAITRE